MRAYVRVCVRGIRAHRRTEAFTNSRQTSDDEFNYESFLETRDIEKEKKFSRIYLIETDSSRMLLNNLG